MSPVMRHARAVLVTAVFAFPAALAQAQHYTDYAFGADVSFLKQVEDGGKQYKDGGVVRPGLQILKDHGYNWIRLRVCVEPVGRGLPNDRAYTVAFAKQAKAMGYKLLLSFHYSNDWADPTNEPTPEAWRALTPEQLVDALFAHTRDTIAALREADVMPEVVGVGNEITNGFCWPVGKLPENWDNLAGLVYAGINGVDAGRGNVRRPRILLHVDHGGDQRNTKRFFDRLDDYDIPYDMIGVSFYPWSHGTLVDLRENLRYIAEERGKDVVLLETGAYWKPSRFFEKATPPFPETPEGQKAWLQAVNEAVMATPGGRGKGVFWWEPAAARGLVARGYFDDEGNALPVLDAFHAFTRPPQRTDGHKPPTAPPSALHFGPKP